MLPIYTLADSLAKFQKITVATMRDRPKPPPTTSYLGPVLILTQPQHQCLNQPKLKAKHQITLDSSLHQVCQNHKPFNTIKNNKALTNKELDKRRAEGCVFGIMRNMLFGRKCKKKQLYTLQLLVGTKDNYDLLMDNRESYI